MRGVFLSEPKFLAIFPRLNARRFPVRTEIPGSIPQFKSEVFVGQNRNSWRRVPICLRGVFRSEPESLATFFSLNARCVSVRTEIPGDISQFEREAFFGHTRNSWWYFPVKMRGVSRPELKFLKIFPCLGARRFSGRTEMPGGISQCKCEVFVGPSQYSWQYLPI